MSGSNTDCNDGDALEYPGQTWYEDVDGDLYSSGDINAGPCQRPVNHYAASELMATSGDCDDTDAEVNPGATEVPYNGKDDDCNAGTLDDDLDSDTYPVATDCDDTDPQIYPGGPPVRISGTPPGYYFVVQNSYNDAVADDIIQSQDAELTEDIMINRNIPVILKGGCDCSFTNTTGTTIINGNMTISDGSVIVQNGTFALQ